MQFFLLFLFFSLCVYLFTLYWIGKDDLFLLRKNIALEQLFNITLLALGIGLFSARVVYVILHPSMQYLNPLVFLVFPYYPGLSLLGGIMGIVAFLFYLRLKRKAPIMRLLDFYAVSLLVALPIGTVGTMFISERTTYPVLFLTSLVYIFVSTVFFMFLYPRLLQNQLPEGSISLAFLIVFSLVQLTQSAFLQTKGIWLFFGVEQILTSIALLISIFLLLQLMIRKKKG